MKSEWAKFFGSEELEEQAQYANLYRLGIAIEIALLLLTTVGPRMQPEDLLVESGLQWKQGE